MVNVKCADCAEYKNEWCERVIDSPHPDMLRDCQFFHEQDRDLIKVIRCKDCKWWGYDDDDGVVRVCHAAKHGHMSSNWSIMIYRTYKGDFYCADAERKEGADG